MLKLALIGDIHKSWDAWDVDYFNRSSYDVLLFLGDLPGRTHSQTLEVARRISRIRKSAFLIPGNHDGVGILHFLAELKQDPLLMEEFASKQEEQCDALSQTLLPVRMAGYSRYMLEADGFSMDLIAGRPHSMGGEHLAYRPFLMRRFGVGSLEESSAVWKRLVDESRSDTLFFFAHNGPAGLGERRNSPWGCDFRRHGGDFGDPDFRIALDYAREKGKRVVGVAAGHMHHALKGKGERIWYHRDEWNTHFVNCARVPRIFEERGERWHHHVEFLTDGERSEINQVLVSEGGEEERKEAK